MTETIFRKLLESDAEVKVWKKKYEMQQTFSSESRFIAFSMHVANISSLGAANLYQCRMSIHSFVLT